MYRNTCNAGDCTLSHWGLVLTALIRTMGRPRPPKYGSGAWTKLMRTSTEFGINDLSTKVYRVFQSSTIAPN